MLVKGEYSGRYGRSSVSETQRLCSASLTIRIACPSLWGISMTLNLILQLQDVKKWIRNSKTEALNHSEENFEQCVV